MVWNNTRKSCFQILANREHRTVISDRRKANEMGLQLPQPTAWREEPSAERETQVVNLNPAELLDPKSTGIWLEISKYQNRGCYTELARFAKDSPQAFGRVLMCVYTRRNYWRPGKEPLGNIKQKMSRTHAGLGTIHIPTTQREKAS